MGWKRPAMKRPSGLILLAAALSCGCPAPARSPAAGGAEPTPAPAAGAPSAPPAQPELAGLPLIEVNSSSVRFGYMAFLLTGENGWEDADRALSRSLAASGVPVVALDGQRFFARRPTPEEASASLERILTHYLSAWNQEKIVAAGRAAGGAALPVMLNRLPERLQARVEVMAGIEPVAAGPDSPAGGWFGGGAQSPSRAVRAEIGRLRAPSLYCFHGIRPGGREICKILDPERVMIRTLQPGRSPEVPYDAAAQEIIRMIR